MARIDLTNPQEPYAENLLFPFSLVPEIAGGR